MIDIEDMSRLTELVHEVTSLLVIRERENRLVRQERQNDPVISGRNDDVSHPDGRKQIGWRAYLRDDDLSVHDVGVHPGDRRADVFNHRWIGAQLSWEE